MKNAMLLMLFFLLALTFNIQAQEKKYVFGDSIYVWASSLNMRESPSPNSKIVSKAPYGSAVVIVDDSIGKVAFRYEAIKSKTLESGKKSKAYYLNGFWVKVNFNGTIGYVFDGYLSKIKPPSSGENAYEKVELWAKKVLKLKPSRYESGDDAWTDYSDNAKQTQIRIGHDAKTAFIQIKLKGLAFQESILMALQFFSAEYWISERNGVYEFQSSDSHSGDCQILISLESGRVVILFSCNC